MDCLGRHWLVELHGCDRGALDDPERLLVALRAAAAVSGVRVVAEASHRYAPQGASAVLLIEESHLSAHSWPEHGYVAIDLYTCGLGDPEPAIRGLAQALGAARFDVLRVERGLRGVAPSLRAGPAESS